MIFSTYWFLLFCLASFFLFYVARVPSARILVILASGVVFQAHFAGLAGMIPIFIMGLSTYFVGLSKSRLAKQLGILFIIITLVYYKYTIFLCRDVIGLIPGLTDIGPYLQECQVGIIVPLGISFFAFEFIHYLVDVMHGGEPIAKTRDFLLFSIFWPTLVAGPIKRYQQFIPSLYLGIRSVKNRDVFIGIVRVCVGLGKKIIVADSLTAYINHLGPTFANQPFSTRWLLLLAIAFRIYLDFSGYSDMAIGYSRMMGVRIPENFNFPYLSTSIAEFWRRWHISLSSWIRDYVYIAMGGSRTGLARKCFNGLAAFIICGFWHGAAWNFALWGVYHGVGLVIQNIVSEKLLPSTNVTFFGSRFVSLLRAIIGWALTMIFVFIGWILFFYPLNTAVSMIRSLVIP